MNSNVDKIYKYSIRKFKVGVGSAIVGLGLVFAGQETMASEEKSIVKQEAIPVQNQVATSQAVAPKVTVAAPVVVETPKVQVTTAAEVKPVVETNTTSAQLPVREQTTETKVVVEETKTPLKIAAEESVTKTKPVEAPLVKEEKIAKSPEVKPAERAGFRNTGTTNTAVVNNVYTAVEKDLQAVTMASPEISNKLAPARISAIEVINKRLEISKATNRKIQDVTATEAENAIKAESVGKLNLDTGFTDAKNDLENLVKGAVADAVRLAPQTTASTLINKIQANKEAFLLGAAYINKYYDLQFGTTNVKDILKTNPSFFGGREKQSALDFLIAIGRQNYQEMGMANTVSTYNKLFVNKVSNKTSIPEFLEYSNKTFNSGKTIQDWYVAESKAYISEVKSKEPTKQDVSYRIYDKFKENAHLQYNILPLLAVSENSVYALSNTAGITYGIVDAYVNKEDATNAPQQLTDFKASLDTANNTQQAFIDFWYRIAKPETHAILNEPTMTVDSLLKKTARNDGLISERWSPQTGDKALLGVKEFITPMGLYANFVQAGGEASGNTVRLYMTRALETNGLTTYAHELTHIYEDKVWMAQGVRDGLWVEFYARGLYEPYQYFADPYFNINTMFEVTDPNKVTNQSPTRFQKPADLKEYMQGTFDVLYTLDLLEAEAVLSKSTADKKWWFNKIKMADTNYVQPGYSHKSNEVVALDDETANKLNTVNDLVDNDIIAERTPVKSFTRTGKFENNGYYSIPMFSSNYAALENDKGVSGDYQTRRMAYELLAQYGYYEGMVPFISNQYKTDAQNAGQVLSDKFIFGKIFGGQFTDAKDFKKEMFKVRQDKLDKLKPVTITYNGQTHTIDSLDKLKALFKDAVDTDLRTKPSVDSAFAYDVRNVELLKEAIYKAYSLQTGEFRDSIYREPLANTNEPTTAPVKATWKNGYVAPTEELVKNAVTIDNKLVKSKELVAAESSQSEITVLVTYTDGSIDKVKVPVSIDSVTKQEVIARTTRFERNDSLDLGQKETVTGKDGSFENVYTYVLESGRFVERVNKQNEVAAIDDLIKVGTKPKVETVSLPKGTEYQADETKDFGFENIVEGKDGQEVRTTTYTMDDQGNVTANQPTITSTEAVNTVVVKGTKSTTRVEETPYTVNKVEAKDLKVGTERVQRKGQNEIVHYVTTYVINPQTGEVVPTITRNLVQEGIDEVVSVGILETAKGTSITSEELPQLQIDGKPVFEKGESLREADKPILELPKVETAKGQSLKEESLKEILIEFSKGTSQKEEALKEIEIAISKGSSVKEIDKPILELPKVETAKGESLKEESLKEILIEFSKGTSLKVEALKEIEIAISKGSSVKEADKPILELPKLETAKGESLRVYKPELELVTSKGESLVQELPVISINELLLSLAKEEKIKAELKGYKEILEKIQKLEKTSKAANSEKVLPKTSSVNNELDLSIPAALSSTLLLAGLIQKRRKK